MISLLLTGDDDLGDDESRGESETEASTASISRDVDLFQNLALLCWADEPNIPTENTTNIYIFS